MRLATLLLFTSYASSAILFGIGVNQLPQQTPATYDGEPSGQQAFNEAQREAYTRQVLASGPFKMIMVSIGLFTLTAAIHIKCRPPEPVLPIRAPVEPPQPPPPPPSQIKSILKPSQPEHSPPAILHLGPAIRYINGRPKIVVNPPGV
jgi:hypothetical protein